MAQIRTAVIGFGKMGMLHGAQSNIHPGMQLVAACENARFTRSAFKAVMKDVQFYADYKRLIDREHPDAIFITTPTFHHHEVALYAAEQKVAIFCEKPLASTYDQAREMADACSTHGVASFVGFHNRYWPSLAKGKELLTQQVIGDVKEIKAQMFIGDVFKENTGWRYNKEMSGGGALIDFGIHMIDLLQWYFGDISAVECVTRQPYSKEVEDEADATLTFANGLTASFESSWSRVEYRKASPIIRIEGEKGEMLATEQTLDVTVDGKTTTYTHPMLYKGDYADIAGISYALEMKAFYEEMQGTRSGLDMAHGAYIQRVVDAMYLSAKEHCEIEVESA